MQKLIKQKVSYFKRKRTSKALKQQEQIKIQPIQLSYTEMSSQYIRRFNSRQCILQTSLIKKNPVYYNDQGYSNNYMGFSSRYQVQNNPQQKSKIIGDSVKKKRINRSSKKSSSKKFKMAQSITIDSYSKSSILNKLTTSRLQTDQELHYIRKNRIVDKLVRNQVTIKLNQQNQTQCKRQKQSQQRYKELQTNNVDINNINQVKQIRNNQLCQNQQYNPQQINNQQQNKDEQNNHEAQGNNQIKQQPEKKIVEQVLVINQQQKLNNNMKKQERTTCPIQLPNTLKEIKTFFYQPILKSKRHVCLLKSVSYSLKQRYLFYSSQLKLLISAQSQLGSIGSNYYFFVGQPKQKQDQQYFGKLRGNMFQSNISLYTNGEHYQSQYDLDRRRQLVGNIITTKQNGQSITKFIIPKTDNVNKKLLKQKWKTLQQFEQKHPNQIICMNERKQIKTSIGIDNKQKQTKRSSLSRQSIMSLQKRKTRDFQPPSKTIIDNEDYHQSLTIKKVYDNLYQVTISEPWSIFQAFGTVLAKCKGKLENL